jgi:hypothetical protein
VGGLSSRRAQQGQPSSQASLSGRIETMVVILAIHNISYAGVGIASRSCRWCDYVVVGWRRSVDGTSIDSPGKHRGRFDHASDLATMQMKGQ